MGADRFHVFYGVRQLFDGSDSTTRDLLENRRHPWQIAARQFKLEFWWGQTVNESEYFILFGKQVGNYGFEAEREGKLSDSQSITMMAQTRERLRLAGIKDQPAWYFQYEPDR
jgi:hypothetical protein